jgi:hypothetical protein
VKENTALGLLLVLVYGGAIVYMGGLSFPPVKDEQQFWEQTRFFAESWPPTLEQIRTYPEPMTPLSFLIWGGLESVHRLGIAAGRVMNIAAAAALLAMIGLGGRGASGPARRHALLAAIGLLLYPYFVPVSVLLYTDIIAALFVTLGFWCYLRERPNWSALFGVLAIATRQYMVAFPAAILAHELLCARRERSYRWATAGPQLVAAASLLGWFWFFGGLGPAAGLAKWPRHTDAFSAIVPSYFLYFLASIGAYFVVPEFLLFRRWRVIEKRFDRKSAWLLVGLVVMFLLFPPNFRAHYMGALNQAAHFVLGEGALADALRVSGWFALAALTVLRFARLDLSFWVVFGNAILMLFLWVAWEKYCLPALAVLWYLKSVRALDGDSGRA